MTAIHFEKRCPPRGKFWSAVGFVFVLQTALIFWASDRKWVAAKIPDRMPAFQLGEPRAPELAAVQDPTLFVLPHAQCFSGEAWMKTVPLDFQPTTWSETEPLRWLAVPEKFHDALTEYIEAHPAASFPIALMPEPTLTLPAITPTPLVWRPSLMRIEGEAAKRQLLNPPPLPLTQEAVTNTVIEVLVDSEGNTFSPLVVARSGSTNNLDELALRIARSSRFQSLEPVGPGRRENSESPLTPCILIFEWQPQPPTNNVSVLP